MIADGDSDGAIVGGNVYVDRPALAVLDRVGQQVAQHPLDAPAVDLGDAGRHRGVDDDVAALALGQRLHRLDDRLGDQPKVDGLDLQDGGARVIAADLEQVREQCFEAVQLGLQDLGAALRRPG